MPKIHTKELILLILPLLQLILILTMFKDQKSQLLPIKLQQQQLTLIIEKLKEMMYIIIIVVSMKHQQ